MLNAKYRQALQNFSILGVSFLLALIAVEGYLRITAYYPLVIKPPYLFDNHPRTGWTLRPNFTGIIDIPEGLVTYTINSQGIRASSDFSTHPGSSLQRIFIIGDSFTFGEGVNEEHTFPRLLNDSMREKHLSVEFVNLGVPGFGTVHSYERLLEYSDLLGVPDILIYLFCTNDPVDNIAEKREVVNGVLMSSQRTGKTLLSYVARAYNHSRFLSLLMDTYYNNFANPRKLKRQELKRQSVDIEKHEDFIATANCLSKMISWAKAHDIHFIVVTTLHSEYSEPLAELLLSKQILLIEADDIFSKFNVNNEPVVLSDGHHWNRHGHQLIAKGIEELLFRQKWIIQGYTPH